MRYEVGDVVVMNCNVCPKGVPIGSEMVVTYVYASGNFEAKVVGGNGYEWFMNPEWVKWKQGVTH